jgi:hypothetical protein
MNRSSGSVSRRRSFYDQLDVDKGATEQDLKKAYKKKALQLHPDKQGGDGEPFKKMKYAYDVLIDPQKRQAYDNYGEAGVNLLEGNVSPDVGMEVFMNISAKQRMMLVLVISLITGFFLLLPILICVKWDHPDALTFVQVFTPIWIVLGGICCCITFAVKEPQIGEDDDEDTRKDVEEKQQQIRQAKRIGYFVICVQGLLFALLGMRLDGALKWSFFAVIWPWILFDVGTVIWYLRKADEVFAMMGGDPELLQQGNRWTQPVWLLFVANLVRSHLIRFIFVIFLAFKLDGMNISWWLVFLPIWVDWAASMLYGLSQCSKVKSQEELEQMTEEQQAMELTPSKIACNFIAQSICLGFVVLFCNKLATPTSYSAYIVFLPIFVTAGCCCCCMSCLICNMAPGAPEDEEQGLGAAAQEASSTADYGATAQQPNAAQQPRGDAQQLAAES